MAAIPHRYRRLAGAGLRARARALRLAPPGYRTADLGAPAPPADLPAELRRRD